MLIGTWADQDFSQRERREAEWLASRPICDECGEPIQDERLFRFGSFIYCPACVEGHSETIDD